MSFLLYWREYAIGALLLIIVGIGFDIYHNGYASCQAQIQAADQKARSDEQLKAVTEQDQYQAQAAKIISDEKAKTLTLQGKLNALQKLPCDDSAIGATRSSLYNSNIRKTYNTGTSN